MIVKKKRQTFLISLSYKYVERNGYFYCKKNLEYKNPIQLRKLTFVSQKYYNSNVLSDYFFQLLDSI